ncbi:MAG: caspase family protein [Actinomycetota bacterium]
MSSPSHDVAGLAEVLSDPEIGNFEVEISMNQSAQKVREAVEDLLADRHLGDVVLLYFSCHGISDLNGRLYFAMNDTKPERLLSTAVADKFVRDALEGTRSRQNILLLDCCFSGAFDSKFGLKGDASMHPAKPFASAKGLVIMTASDSTQFAFEGKSGSWPREMSVFSHHIAHGLRTGEADLDSDGEIGIDELYDYVLRKVVDEVVHQRPGLSAQQLHGKLVIAHSKRSVGKLPTEIVEAVRSTRAGLRLGAVRELSVLARSPRAGVAGAARAQLSAMRHDDSKSVAQAAALALSGKSSWLRSSLTRERTETRAPDHSTVDGGQALRQEQSSRLPHDFGPKRKVPPERFILAALFFFGLAIFAILAIPLRNESAPDVPKPTQSVAGPVASAFPSPPIDPFAQIRAFSAALSDPSCAQPSKRFWRDATLELSCTLDDGTIHADLWTEKEAMDRAMRFLSEKYDGSEEPWVQDGQRKGSKLDYYMPDEDRWAFFWVSDDQLVSAKAIYVDGNPIAAREWWTSKLQMPGH